MIDNSSQRGKATIALRARQDNILCDYATGITPDEISLKYHLDLHTVNSDIQDAVTRMLKHYTSSPQMTFIRYASFHLSIIRKLQQAVDKFNNDDSTVQYNSIISALKTQSDIYDKILNKGQQYGIIEAKSVSKGVKSQDNLRTLIQGEVLKLSSLLEEIDMSINFHSKRKSDDVKIIAKSERVAPIIIKPIEINGKLKKALPDWKYSQEFVRDVIKNRAINPEEIVEPELRRLAELKIKAIDSMVKNTNDNNLQSPNPNAGKKWLAAPVMPRAQEEEEEEGKVLRKKCSASPLQYQPNNNTPSQERK